MKILFLLSMLYANIGFAQTPTSEVCTTGWQTSQLKSQSHTLSLVLTEKGVLGAACDLVVRSFHYVSELESLILEVSPAKFCPLDAVREREAKLVWHLPYELRESGRLKLIVNGSRLGTVVITGDEALFVGRCK